MAEIFPLRLRLRKEFRFFQIQDQVVAERVEDSQRFSVRRWQYEMLLRFDGKRTFEEAAKEVFQKEGGGFTAVGLLNFYRWLYQEDLVLCECDSVFELVGDEDQSSVQEEPAKPPVAGKKKAPARSPVAGKIAALWGAVDQFVPGRPGMKQAIKIAAMVVFGLSVLRLGFVAAPVFEPPVNRLYAEVENFFYDGSPKPVESELSREIADSPQKEVQFAGRAGAAPIDATPEKVSVSEDAIPDVPPAGSPELGQGEPANLKASLDAIDDLRRRMSECRIRRDEFYIQNNEAGYRREVEKMSALAKEIGEIESRL